MTRRFLALLIALALISPVFGVWLADLINYHEPLDVAADLINQAANRTILNDTRVPDELDALHRLHSAKASRTGLAI
jgi:hypothetical protein